MLEGTMTRATQRHRIYEVDKAGWISIYPSMGAPRKECVLSGIITLLKVVLERLHLGCLQGRKKGVFEEGKTYFINKAHSLRRLS